MAVKLKAVIREDLSKSNTKALRSSGQVPAVVYGKERDSKAVAVDNLELLKTLRDEGRNAIISLDIEKDSSVDVMLHEYQTDAIKNELIHADFFVVDMTEEMEVSVPVRIEGEAEGVRDGGILQQPLYEVVINVKPANIPEDIEVDVTSLAIGDVISIADLPKSDKFEYVEEPDTVVVSVVPPVSESELEQSDAPADAEPELVGSEEKDEE